MFVLIVGCGRVGSAIAKQMLSEGNEVSVLDEDPEAIALLNRGREPTRERAAAAAARAGRPPAGGSVSAPGPRWMRWSRPGSRPPPPSGHPPTATTPTS